MSRRRREAEALSPDDIRQKMLFGITDPTAVALYDEGMKTLDGRNQADFASAMQLRDAAQWTVVINKLQGKILEIMGGEEESDAKLRRLMKSKREAEEARRRVLDGLLLTPQKKRGRPAEEQQEKTEDAPPNEWDAFPTETFSAADDPQEPEEEE